MTASRSRASDEDIVVTGARVRASPAARRGDWNACAVTDPKQDVSACSRQIARATAGALPQVAGQFGAALSAAWHGDEGAAIAGFSAVIGAAPKSAEAYLNRGLLYQRAGADAAALKDFDRAVTLAPRRARYLYARALAFRRNGDAKRARADEDRAVELDPGYDAILR